MENFNPVPKPAKRRKHGKTPRQVQIKRLDEKFAILIKLQRGLVCEQSGKRYIIQSGKIPQGCQISHIKGRKYHHTRWHPDNVFVLSGRVHNFIFHGNPDEFLEFVEMKGRDILALRDRANKTEKVDYTAVELWIDQELLKVLRNYSLDYTYYKSLEPLYGKIRK